MLNLQKSDNESGHSHSTGQAMAKNLINNKETQGYIMFFSGLVLFLYSVGWLPEGLESILNFVFAAAAVGLSLYGAHKAILWSKAQKFYQQITKK